MTVHAWSGEQASPIAAVFASHLIERRSGQEGSIGGDGRGATGGRVDVAPAAPAPSSEPDEEGRIGRIVATYVAVAAAWVVMGVLAAGTVASFISIDPAAAVLVHGLLFVAVSALVLRIVLQRYGRKLAVAAEAEQRAADRLREVARIRSSFLRGVSHELRTPLTNIVGYGHTLNDHMGQLEPEVAEEFAGRLVINARRLEKLVLDLLDLESSTHADIPVVAEPVRLDALVSDVLERFEDQDHVIHVKVEDVVVHLDRDKSDRLLEELVRNALRHTPAGTNIWVYAGTRGRTIRLTVEDDGPGIDAELRGDLFEPFTQGVGAGRSPSPGLGIGLALVRRYVTVQHGRVRLVDGVAGGARFDVVLPRRQPAS